MGPKNNTFRKEGKCYEKAMLRLITGRKDSVEAYACACNCSCPCAGGANKVTQAVSNSSTSAQKPNNK